MKRILIATLVGVMAFSVVTLGGWKFGAEQQIDIFGGLYPLEAYVGWDFDAPFIDMTALSIAGDFVITRADLWAITGLTLVDGELVFSYKDTIDVILSLGGEIDYAPLPTGVNLVALDGGAEVVGYVNDVLTLNAGVDFVYRLTPMDFLTTFFVGFHAEW